MPHHPFTPEALTGADRRHIRQVDAPRFAAHPGAADAFLAMRAAARRDGFDLRPFSSFRDLKTQTRIWRRKFRLEKPIYDAAGEPIDASRLSDDEKVWVILGWSAPPGASRHHWGSEIDVVDGAVVDAGHAVDLLPYETAPDGPFHALHEWLDANLAEFGFFRPYDVYRGGMFAEPWHLSHAPTAARAVAAYDLEIWRGALAPLSFPGKDALLRQSAEIWRRFVCAVASPPETILTK